VLARNRAVADDAIPLEMEFLLRLTVFLTIVATAVAWKAAAPEPEPEPLITPGFAAVIILAHTLLTKSMMTMIWRGPGSKADRAGFPNWMVRRRRRL
jgi:hypothetical protein